MKKKSLKILLVMMMAFAVFAMLPVTASAASGKPGAVKITSYKVGKVSRKNSTVKITVMWKKVPKATGYEVWEKHGTGQWTKLKKCGRFVKGVRIKKVPTGEYSIKVRALSKVKGKTYKGKFSKVKKKFTASPLSLEQFANAYPRLKSIPYNYGTITFSGNVVVVSMEFAKLFPEYAGATLEELSDPVVRTALYDDLALMSEDAAQTAKFMRANTGVRNVGVKYRVVSNGTEIIARSF